jgi:hypothetical protein
MRPAKPSYLRAHIELPRVLFEEMSFQNDAAEAQNSLLGPFPPNSAASTFLTKMSLRQGQPQHSLTAPQLSPCAFYLQL